MEPTRPGRLLGRVALVTGAGSGIARATARAFARAGASVVCADIDEAAAESSAQAIRDEGGTARAHHLDVSSEASCNAAVQRAVREFEGLDTLVNGAGTFDAGAAGDVTPAVWERALAVNLTGPYLMSRSALPHLAERSGSILNIASVSGIQPFPGAAAYVAAKHGVIGLTKSMALDYGARGVRVNAICPGPTATAMTDALYARAGSVDEARARRGRTLPLGRMGQPEDIAHAAVHLASDEASWCTGVIHTVDGGQSLGPAPHSD